MTKQQSGSMENYLEMIAMLGKEKNIVRVTQLSTALGVKKSSVSAALTKLSKQGLVKHEKYGYVELTPEGEKIAHDILHRHKVLEQFLVEILGVNQKVAWKDACEMEHYISPVTIQKLTMFVEHVMSKSLQNISLLQWINENSEHDMLNEDPSKIPDMIEGSNY
jgi:DtxR family Mn-dependent transcriptional regulator